jgi:hypothetical protein
LRFLVEDLDGNKKDFIYTEDVTIQKKQRVAKQHLNKIKSLLNLQKNKMHNSKNFAYIVSHNLRSYSGSISSLFKLDGRRK